MGRGQCHRRVIGEPFASHSGSGVQKKLILKSIDATITTQLYLAAQTDTVAWLS
jgi:hypothetical protein